MNRYAIEKRDREVVEKFRAVVESNEQRKKRNRIRLFVVFSVIFCAVLILFEKYSSPPDAPGPVMYKSNKIALTRGDAAGPSRQAIRPVQPQSAESITDAAAMVQAEKPPLSAPVQAAAPPVIPDKKETIPPSHILTPHAALSGKKGLSSVQLSPVREIDIRIAEILTCSGVKRREAVARKGVFSIKDGATPHVWMDVRSKNLPYTLRHVYYHDGRRYCAVPLKISYPRTRTWSNVTLRHPYEAGLWRVDVVTQKGNILSRVEFTVVP